MRADVRKVVVAVATLLPLAAIAAGGAGAKDDLRPPPPTPIDGRLSPYPQQLRTPADREVPPSVGAGSALLVDLDSGGVLYRRAAGDRRPVASLTKVMTALVVVRSTPLDEVVSISPAAVFDEREFGSSSTLGLRAGERQTVRDLLFGALAGSANDAARALAIHVSGSETAFVRRMNRTAATLGMRHTTFRSATGLDDRGVSTAEDLRRLAEAALEEPVIAEIVATRFHQIPGPQRKRTIQNRNALLWLYPGATGMKTGSTRGAGFCLLATAERDGRHLLAVVLGAPDDAFSEAAALLNYGFAGFSVRTVVQAGQDFGSVPLRGGAVQGVAGTALEALVPDASVDRVRATARVDHMVGFPPAPGQRIGVIRVSVDRLVLGTVPLVAGEVPSPPPAGAGPWWARAAGAVAAGFGGLLGAFFD